MKYISIQYTRCFENEAQMLRVKAKFEAMSGGVLRDTIEALSAVATPEEDEVLKLALKVKADRL
jgi:hypothetical protein